MAERKGHFRQSYAQGCEGIKGHYLVPLTWGAKHHMSPKDARASKAAMAPGLWKLTVW